MADLCRLIWCALVGLFRSRASREAEILALRHQLNVLRRKSPKRPTFRGIDRLVLHADVVDRAISGIPAGAAGFPLSPCSRAEAAAF